MKYLLMTVLMCLGLVACGQQPASAPMAASSPYTADLVWHTDQIQPAKLDYTPASEEKTYYYAVNGERLTSSESHGYYRQILGQTADGRTVAQDFYTDTRTPQTSPFVMTADSDEATSALSVLDSAVIWYKEGDGDIISTAVFKAGVLQGWQNVYEFKQLVLQIKQAGNERVDIRFFSPDEKIWGEAQIQNHENGLAINKLQFFHPNGVVMSEMKMDAQGKPAGMTTFDDTGKITAAKNNAKHNELLLRRFAQVMDKLPVWLTRG